MWQRKNDEEIEPKPLLGPEVPPGIPSAAGESDAGDKPVSVDHPKLEAHVPHVQSVGHAAESRDGDGEPAVDEDAHTRVAYR